ncbi:DUF2157 domain-containing protein [Novosphingobium sp.]|uniref:DUF2157 domain-containing protein n=1 Tax=Novosphingobium sp. TaxID=1874826 RepID=UPI0026000D17|nr:DUF2157 domain-containing protein [Novosphingobium sp.]
MNERKLSAWVAAGAIDAEAAARIRSFEAQHSRPLALWAVVGIGALAIALGLVSVVAANWDAIPAMVRLGAHFALLLGAAIVLWAVRGQQGWGEEALLFVQGALGLTFMGHIGQAYQTTSPLWQPLALWLAFFAPLFLLRGQNWLAALGVGGVLIAAVWTFAADNDARDGSFLVFALPTALPLLMAPLGAALRVRSARGAFWRRLEELGFGYGLAGASMVAILAGVQNLARGGDADKMMLSLLTWAAAGFAAAWLVWTARRDRSGQAAAWMLAAAGMVALVAWPLSGNRVIGALLYMVLWAGVAAMALRGGWRGVFQLAVALLALRLIVLSFELEDNLLSSGAGLIVSGLLIIAIAWIAVRVARKYAPPREAAP